MNWICFTSFTICRASTSVKIIQKRSNFKSVD